MELAAQSNGSMTVEHPNADTIAGLREIADWLEQHPELPEVWYATIQVGNPYTSSPTARQDLIAFAAALGERAEEDSDGSTIRISGKFSGVEIKRGVPIGDLCDKPMPPKYEPILKPKPEPIAVTPEEDDAWGAIS